MISESPSILQERAEDPAAAAPATDAGGRQPMINASVMMIDDEPILTEVVGAFLADAGYRDFRGENDPVVAMQHLRTEQPDVLLLDLKMPGMSGFEVLRQVRADPVTRMTPVIVLTSASDARTKLRVLELGATDFLEKPVDPSELVLRLRNTLAFKAWRDRSQWYDMLTGLPNRKLLISRLGAVMHETAALGQVCALVLVEVAGLRRLAAAFGHRAADGAAQAVAQRLQGTLRSAGGSARSEEAEGDNLVARIGQDEFAVMVAGLRRAEDAAAIARRLLPVLAEPLRIEGRDWFPSPALGVAAAPADADQAEALLRCARTAAMQVREQGGGLGFYSAELNDVALERLTLESELRQALERGEFELHYQPKVDAVGHRITGCEALIRWRHPSRGLVPPGLFIPIAEEAGVIVDIGTWVLNEACRAARRWRDAGLACPVSVNVASPHLRDRRLVRDMQAALEANGLDGSSLVVELTESMLMTPGDDSAATLAELSALGVALSLDDFGTGYSSFAYLKKLNLDELKIDRSFVSGLPDDREDRAIVEAIVAMAHALGLKTVAEGVETVAQADALRELGCDHCQGWAFGRPQPEPQFVQTLRSAAVEAQPAG